MATTATPLGFTAVTTASEAAPAKAGFLSRFFERIVAARIARAERHVQPYLARMNDERLRDLGFTANDIERLREKHYAQAVYFS